MKSHQEIAPPSSMDTEKIDSLKSLNQILLKEAVERRKQVDSLLKAKGSLEMELTRSNSEREALDSELGRLVDRAALLEVERVVVAVFVAVQVGVKGEEFAREIKGLEMEMREWKRESEEKESEIGRLNVALIEIEGALGDEREVSRQSRLERDDFEDKLNRQIKEDEGLRANLSELDGKMKEIEREIEELHAAYNGVVREKKDMEMRIKLLMGEKDLSERGLMESNKVIEKMKEEISGIVREKEGVEREKNDELVKRRELANVVMGLNETVANLQKEEVKLQMVISELEKNCVAGEEKLKEMAREVSRLVEETKLSEKRISTLVDEKTVVEKDLGEALKQLAKQKSDIEDLANEKLVMVEAKNRVDGEVGELQNQVDELKATVLGLEESNRADVERIRRLESEVREYMSNLEKVSVERDGVERFLNEEKQNASRLKEKIEELEKKIEECHKVAVEVNAKNAAILAEKVELESHCETQREEIASLQSKVELADANSELVLNMLKGTSAFCLKGEQEARGEGHNVVAPVVDGEELKTHLMEMETIKNAFKSKAARVEDMEKQLECLQSSVVDAEKWKSFWAMLSSATTVLAAISLAYVARGH